MVKKLAPQQEAILAHVARYRLMLPSLLAASGIVDGLDPQTAASALEGLTTAGLLAPSPLSPGYSDEPYYHLSPRGARQLGQDAEFGKPLPRDLRIESFAIAKFCCGAEGSRQLLTKQEFQEKFEALWFSGQPVRYCLERESGRGTRLAFIKVDHDGAGRWDRLIDSCARFLRQRTDPKQVSPEHRPQVEAFAELVRRGQFAFAVLTSLADKKRALDLELERRVAAGESAPPIRVHVISGLFALIFPEIKAPQANEE